MLIQCKYHMIWKTTLVCAMQYACMHHTNHDDAPLCVTLFGNSWLRLPVQFNCNGLGFKKLPNVTRIAFEV